MQYHIVFCQCLESLYVRYYSQLLFQFSNKSSYSVQIYLKHINYTQKIQIMLDKIFSCCKKKLCVGFFWKRIERTKYVVVSKLFLVLCHHWFYFKSHELAKKVFNKSFTSSRAEVVCFHNYFPFMMLIVRMFSFLSFLDNRHDVRFAQFNYSFAESKFLFVMFVNGLVS